jgi:transcriptional regulator with XRE-family HTH domain
LIDGGTVKKQRPGRSSSKSSERGLLLFAGKVRASRAVLGWSQTELGRRAGITQRAVYCIENALTRPRKATEQQIEASFSEVGLVFTFMFDGGFKMTVPFAAIGRSSVASQKRMMRRRKGK